MNDYVVIIVLKGSKILPIINIFVTVIGTIDQLNREWLI